MTPILRRYSTRAIRDVAPPGGTSPIELCRRSRPRFDAPRAAIATGCPRSHGARNASLTLFECEDDHDTATALFEQAFEWARRRGLTRTVGPRGLGALDGYGLLVDGFDRRQLMTMTGYNPRFTNAPGRYCRNTLIEEMQSLKLGRHGPETRSRSGTSAV